MGEDLNGAWQSKNTGRGGLMYLLGLDFYKDEFLGVIEREDKYIVFHVSREGSTERGAKYKKEHYHDFEEFKEICLKFHPHLTFLEERKRLKNLDYDVLLDMWKEMEEVSRGGASSSSSVNIN